jgi:hypothetical protein
MTTCNHLTALTIKWTTSTSTDDGINTTRHIT